MRKCLPFFRELDASWSSVFWGGEFFRRRRNRVRQSIRACRYDANASCEYYRGPRIQHVCLGDMKTRPNCNVELCKGRYAVECRNAFYAVSPFISTDFWSATQKMRAPPRQGPANQRQRAARGPCPHSAGRLDCPPDYSGQAQEVLRTQEAG